MEALLKLILENIVTDKDSLKIEEVNQDGYIVYELELSDEDKGLVIGSKGKNIKAIRNILSIIAKREGQRVNISIKD